MGSSDTIVKYSLEYMHYNNEVIEMTETFMFNTLPKNVTELTSLNEATLDTPFKTVALAMCALTNFENSADDTFAMLDFLKGPEPVSPFEKQFIKERLAGKQYKVSSFFAGTSPENGYTPSIPYTITVSDNPYSYSQENWATLYVKSSGADSERSIKLRKKPSTGQWFINEIQCLSDIRVPVSSDPWA